ncbi:MAG TPA: HAD-IC family P-type ATPase, partial [Patescibacteria group bacterium]|nr:HAD-IC family P-type ATPase [Patescibacteria group bacterium]
MDVEAVARLLETDRSHGLSEEEAAARLAEVGPNAIGSHGGQGPAHLLLEQVSDPLVVILLVAAGLSGFVLGETTEAAVILAIVVLNAGLGFFQQYRAELALGRLRELAAPTATVKRLGRTIRIQAADLVPGDLIKVRAGARVPADARVAEAHHLETAEALLTGEAFPEMKNAHAVDAVVPLADRTSMIYMGTTLVSGRGEAIVTATARATAMGGIAGLLTEKRPHTPLQRELVMVGRVLGAAALATVALLFCVGWLEGYPAHEMFLTAVALAVSAVPEGLPAVVTITLARGVQRLAAQAVIVRRLQAVETLGAATVVCTDKTGTLTRNRIEVHEVVLEGLRGAPQALDRDDARVRRCAEVAALCNDS